MLNPHTQTPLTWFGDEPAPGRLGVVLLHGRTQSPAQMKELLVDRLALRNVSYAAPSASGNTWYPNSFLVPVMENEPSRWHALEAVQFASDGLSERGIGLASQVVLGFSQGACLGAEYVYRSGRRCGALLALTGGLMGPPGTTWEPGRWTDMPVLLGGSRDDPWVPATRMEETAAVFKASGARVELTFYEGSAHGVPDDQVQRARAVLLGLGATS